MTNAEDMMANQPAMAEMAGGVLEADGRADMKVLADGTDATRAVAAELAAEGHSLPPAVHPAPTTVAPGLAALEAETED